jgi:hypothetical protein
MSTYILRHQTHQGQLLPRIAIFAGQPTSYTTRHTKVSYCLTYQSSHVNLHPTPPDTPGSATASHSNLRRSTYKLHHQTHQGQPLPRISIFARQRTSYTPRHTVVSYCLAYQSSQVNLLSTSPDTPGSATASHSNLRRSTYKLHHQTHQGQPLPRISIFARQLTSYITRHIRVSYCLAYQSSHVNLHPTPPDTPGSATALHINLRTSTYFLHHQTHQGQLLLRISIFAGQLTSYTTRHTKVSYCLA